MLMKIVYALITAFVYVAFNYETEKTIAEQKNLFVLGTGVFVGSFLLFYFIFNKTIDVGGESYGSEYSLSDGGDFPFPE